MSTYTIQAVLNVTDDAVDTVYIPSNTFVTASLYFRGSPSLGATVRIRILRDGYNGTRVLQAGGWSGNYSLATPITCKIELEESGGSWTAKYYTDGTLRDTDSLGSLSPTNLYAHLTFQGTGGGGASWSLEADWDDFYYWINAAESVYDDFGDGDLTVWPVYSSSSPAFNNSETGGVWLGDDNGAGIIRTVDRYRELDLTVPTGLGGDFMTTDHRTETVFVAYNDSGDIKVQTFYPGSTSPDATVTVLSSQGDLLPSLTFAQGKLKLALSDGSTRKESADPTDVSSWGNWAAD